MNGTLLLLVMLVALGVTGVAHNRQIQPGLIIVLLGSAASFLPGLPRLELAPEFILGVVIPPLLYSAAYNVSLWHFIRNIRAIVGLGVSLVAVTTVVIGYVAQWLLPSLGLATCFLLAAVLSPPDTVTSVTHGRDLGLTRRVQDILLGESLVNDAMALTLFALALSATTSSHIVSDNPLLLFLYEAVLGIMVGALLAALGMVVRVRMKHPSLEVAFGFILPFAAYLTAEYFHASGILAVVTAAFLVSINTLYDPRMHSASTYLTRLKESEFWSVVDTLLEAFVFAYMGLQLRFVLEDLRGSSDTFGQTLTAGVLILLAVMGLRLLWVLLFFGPIRARWKDRPRRGKRPRQPPKAQLSWQENLLIGWTGMRGIITLAAAAGVPLTLANGEPFPGRAAIQAIAFIVAVGTLLIQGSTLPLVSRTLKIDLKADDTREAQELEQAQGIVQQAPTGDYNAQRLALASALRTNEVDERAARILTNRLDLEQAAKEAAGEV